MSCERCAEYEFVCPSCGSVIAEEYAWAVPYSVLRREIKNLIWTSAEETFVWILMFEGRPVKVGHGGLTRLLNETRPNANYIRFDTALVYWCPTVDLRDEFCCRLIGSVDGLTNRRGVNNKRYKTKKDIHWKVNPSNSVKESILQDPDFEICGVGYWDVLKLEQFGVMV